MTKTTPAPTGAAPDAKFTVILDGTLTAVSPIAVSPPKPQGERDDGDRVQRLPRMPIMEDGSMRMTAYLPASTIRGALRRAAVAAAIDLLAENGAPKLTPNDYLLLALGGVKDRKDEGGGADDTKGVDLQAVRDFRLRNPLVSLFGAMAIDVGGNLRVGHGIPAVPLADPGHLGVGARHDPFARQPALLELFDADAANDFLTRNDFRLEGNRLENQAEQAKRKLGEQRRSRTADPEKVKELTEQVARLDADAKAAFERAGGKVNIQQPLAGYEALPVGLEMRHRVVADQVPPVELALLLAALERFALAPVLGAHVAHGCGEVTGSWSVSVARRGAPAEPAGTIAMDNYRGLKIDTDHPVMLDALAIRSDLPVRSRAFDLRSPD